MGFGARVDGVYQPFWNDESPHRTLGMEVQMVGLGGGESSQENFASFD